MVAESDGSGPLGLPVVPSRRGSRDGSEPPSREPQAQGALRAREDRPGKRGSGHSPYITVNVARALQLAGLWHAKPYSLSQWWMVHRHDADIWRSAAPVPKPVLTVYEWGQLVAGDPLPAGGGLSWIGRWRLVWGAIHLVTAAAVYFLTWLLSTVPRFLLTAGAIALAVWLL